MDSNKGRSKAVLRSLMKDAATRKEKKIDSPLVRYNDIGQAVCKICNIVIKSEGLWTAHLVSKAHKEKSDGFQLWSRRLWKISKGGQKSQLQMLPKNQWRFRRNRFRKKLF